MITAIFFYRCVLYIKGVGKTLSFNLSAQTPICLHLSLSRISMRTKNKCTYTRETLIVESKKIYDANSALGTAWYIIDQRRPQILLAMVCLCPDKSTRKSACRTIPICNVIDIRQGAGSASITLSLLHLFVGWQIKKLMYRQCYLHHQSHVRFRVVPVTTASNVQIITSAYVYIRTYIWEITQIQTKMLGVFREAHRHCKNRSQIKRKKIFFEQYFGLYCWFQKILRWKA